MYDLQVLDYEKFMVRTIMVKDEIWWVLADISKVLGIVNHKQIRERLDDDEVGMFDIPHPQNARKTLKISCVNESGLYSVILRSDKPEAKKFKRWVTHEVLPTIRKTGTYSMKEEQPQKPYEYFDKTYNGEPVLTTADIEYITGINKTTVASWFNRKAKVGKDYYRLEKGELQKFKTENARLSKLVKRLYAVTKSGFVKFCNAYGIMVETPKCFDKPKAEEQTKISAVHRIYDTFCKYYDIKRYILTEDVAKALDCGKNGLVNESCLLYREDKNEYKMFTDEQATLIERQFLVAENLGRIIAGQFRENANTDINYTQDARTFAAVVMAMSLFFDN